MQGQQTFPYKPDRKYFRLYRPRYESVDTILGIFINKRENKFPISIFIDKIQNLIIKHNFF